MALQPKRQHDGAGQALRISQKITPQVTKYYLKVSKRYRAMQGLLLILLMVYLFFIISAFGKHITYDNMQYLLRDLDSLSHNTQGDFSVIEYDKQNEPAFAIFKNGIAAAGKDGVTLYDSTGLRLFKEQLSCTSPVLVPSEKYLLLYDRGGTGYSVYNSITKVISRSTERKIADGAISDSGAFILVTRSNDTKYVVEYFSSILTNTMKIYKDNYVMDTALSKDGKTIVVCSAVPSQTDLDCEIALYHSDDKEFIHTVTIPHTMPLSVHFGESGFTVLCDSGLYFYDEAGTELSSYGLTGMTLEYADLSDRYTILTGCENALGSEHRVLVFEADGTLLADSILKERITGVSAPHMEDEGTLAYVLTADNVLRLTPGEEQAAPNLPRYRDYVREEAQIDMGDVIALRPAPKGVIAFTENTAYYLFR
ncbi:MAG: hypothetical protein E7638_09035 [Ruminococcaceae bacterium]|nr:hypothetical protein [Oscillospiraceae bacterium]